MIQGLGLSQNDSIQVYHRLVKKGDSLVEIKSYSSAYEVYKEAYHLNSSDTLDARIQQTITILKEKEGCDSVDKNYDKIVDKAEDLYDQREYKKSRALFERALMIRPQDSKVLKRIKLIDQLDGDFDLNSNEFKVGDVYIPKPKIMFDFDRETIIPKCYPQLDSIAKFLLKHDSLIIEIGVHMDSRGSDKYSRRLDQNRAESVKEYLVNKGIRQDRMVAIGYGESQFIISEEEIDKMESAREKEEAHAINRRVEFKILNIIN